MVIGTYRPVDIVLSDHPLKELKAGSAGSSVMSRGCFGALGRSRHNRIPAGEAPETILAEALAAPLYRHSEGNPLLMVAALEHLEERGLIRREPEAGNPRLRLRRSIWACRRNLSRMIEAQIEQLSTEEKRVLEAASLESAGHSGSRLPPELR